MGTITINDVSMSEEQPEYDQQPKTINKRLDRVSMESIHRLGRKWQTLFNEDDGVVL